MRKLELKSWHLQEQMKDSKYIYLECNEIITMLVVLVHYTIVNIA